MDDEPSVLKDGEGRRYPLEPWPGGGGYTVKAPEFRQWAGKLEDLSRRVAFLRLVVTEIKKGAVCRELVRDFKLVLDAAAQKGEPDKMGVVFERIDANIQTS